LECDFFVINAKRPVVRWFSHEEAAAAAAAAANGGG